MNPLSLSLGRSPELFPFGLDAATDSLRLVRASEAHFAQASFLDDRFLPSATESRVVPFEEVLAAVDEARLPEACDFIFHIGHVGSTLLSRLLGRHQAVFALREPAVLRTLAQIRIESEQFNWDAANFEAHLSTLLKLWSRTWRPDQRALLKATSFVSELAPEILSRDARPKAIFMSVAPVNYLATILGAEHSPREARTFAPMRLQRLNRRLQSDIRIDGLSIGELVAMSWIAEMSALMAALPVARDRILWIDFDQFLTRPADTLATCFRHLNVQASGEQIAAIIAGPDMNRYSKDPEHGYDAQLRRDVLAQAHGMHGAEIKRGLEWLGKLAAKHPEISQPVPVHGLS